MNSESNIYFWGFSDKFLFFEFELNVNAFRLCALYNFDKESFENSTRTAVN
jgi:hypothetical protein